MLHAALVTSPHAHARILGYQLDAARALPGVKAILTGDDLNGPRSGGIVKDESMVARGRCATSARSWRRSPRSIAKAANRAAAAIEVDVRALRSALTIDQALAPGAPILHADCADYFKAIQGGGHDNMVFESCGRRRRCRARLPRMRRGRGGHLGDPGAAPPLSGAERLRGGRRRGRAHHAPTRPASRCTTSSNASPKSSASRWRRSVSGDPGGRRFRRQACVEYPFDRRLAGARRAAAR